MRLRLPWMTLALCVAATLAWCWPAASAALVYEREAISAGEAWRLATGHLVHFSMPHLGANLAFLLVAGLLLEQRGSAVAAALYVLALPLIGMLLWWSDPRLAEFGGASGLVFAAMALAALQALDRPGSRRLCGALVLCLLLAKVAAEWHLELQSGMGAADGDFELVPLAHAGGLLSAAIVHAALKLRRIVRTARLISADVSPASTR